MDYIPPALPAAPPLGMYAARIDAQGLLRLPQEIRSYLLAFPDRRVFMTSLDWRTTRIYPQFLWEAVNAFVAGNHPDGAISNVGFNAMDLGETLEMDAQGRIPVPAKLREELDLMDQELRLFVLQGYIEIVNQKTYDDNRRAARGPVT